MPEQFPRFNKKNIPTLTYAVIHSQQGRSDGVSIVMDQVEDVMIRELGIPKERIFYLTGKSGKRNNRVTVRKELFLEDPENVYMRRHYDDGFGGDRSERIERALAKAQAVIEEFMEKRKPDVLIAHNTCHPVNFILSVALHRYYRDQALQGKKTPKYILWWHDSHLERTIYKNPASDVRRYLLQGVPGRFVEYIMFINSLQFFQAESYFKALDELKPGYFEEVQKNHSVMYNTTNTFIESYEELESDKFSSQVERFLDEFKVKELLEDKRVSLAETMFCLQHTRILERKRIDFALEYCFALFAKLQKKRRFRMKAFYFLVSGHSADSTKRKLKALYKKLCQQYQMDKFFLVFAEENKKTTVKFEEFPLIFAKLKGFSTYFSEVEGFGNNLLEVLASGLIPVVYTYPVFNKDIAKYHFKMVAMDKFEVSEQSLEKTIDILQRDHKRKLWVNRNLVILKKHFPHRVIGFKLKRAIIRRRTHV